MHRTRGVLRAGLLAIVLLSLPRPTRLDAQSAATVRWDRMAREIFGQLIEINTTDADGSTTLAAEAMAARLREAGFSPEDVLVIGPQPRKGNLVARLRGADRTRAPVLLLAHLDVVQAHPEDWTLPPFEFVEQDGFYYGRGTSDDKAMAAIWVTNLIRYKEEGFTPARDLVVALTADEEGGDFNGVDWLLTEHPDLIRADYALNEGGGGAEHDGRRLYNEVQVSEKVYQSYWLEITNPGGHSSLSEKDNAIYRLAHALVRIESHRFPAVFDEVTRTFLERSAATETLEIAQALRGVLRDPPDPAALEVLSDLPHYNARLRTTCVATELAAGHAENALPQRAQATINCRVFPGNDPREVQAMLVRLVADTGISVTPMAPARPSPASPLRPDVMDAIEQVTEAMWPGVPVIPTMVTGATDGLYLRNRGVPVYGVSGLFEETDDVRAHGRNERIGVREFHEGQEFLYRLVRTLTQQERPVP